MAGRTGSRYRATQGLNRVGTAIKAATSSYSKALTVGDITAGDVVEVAFAAVDEATATVRERATGAIVIDNDVDNQSLREVTISGTTVTVGFSGTVTGTVLLWVF